MVRWLRGWYHELRLFYLEVSRNGWPMVRKPAVVEMSAQSRSVIDQCARSGAVFVTSCDAWLSIGSDEYELIAVLRYAEQRGVTVHVLPHISRPAA